MLRDSPVTVVNATVVHDTNHCTSNTLTKPATYDSDYSTHHDAKHRGLSVIQAVVAFV